MGLHQGDEDQHRRNALCNDGGVGNTRDPHIEPEHEQHIQHHIGDSRYHEKIKRALGVSDGAQNTRAHIVDHQADDARKIDGEIGFGEGIHPVVAAFGVQHHSEHPRGHRHPDGGEYHAENQGQRDRGVGGALDVFFAFGTVILRDHDTRTRRQTAEKADEDVHNGGNAADGGVRAVFARLSDDPRIDHIVQLLEQIARQKR